jgi:hypothetical protein
MGILAWIAVLNLGAWAWARPKMPPEAQAACGADFEKYCPVNESADQHMQCLLRNEPQVSLTCGNFLAEYKKQHSAVEKSKK